MLEMVRIDRDNQIGDEHLKAEPSGFGSAFMNG
jgi:hypothetical protein